MANRLIPKPQVGEYAPYTMMYIGLLPDDGRVLDHLQSNLEKTATFIRSFPAEKLSYRITPREWTIKEILVHIIDDERIYAYRALRFARNDKSELPGFEQDEYIPYSRAMSVILMRSWPNLGPCGPVRLPYSTVWTIWP